jgi:hypothetical protein
MLIRNQNPGAVAAKAASAGKVGSGQLWKRFVTALMRALGVMAS